MVSVMIQKTCINCGEDYKTYSCRTSRKFCSKQCYLEYQKRDNFEVECSACGEIMELPRYRHKKDRQYHCSYQCRKTSKTVECSHCGKKFQRKPAEIKDNNFCSRDCMGKWQSENMVGENSPTWLGGWEKYYGANWEEQKNLARERDDYKCQRCGKKENGKAHDVHHKTPFRVYGIDRYTEANRLGNLITLCNPCHSKIEPKRRQRWEEFTGQKAEKIS